MRTRTLIKLLQSHLHESLELFSVFPDRLHQPSFPLFVFFGGCGGALQPWALTDCLSVWGCKTSGLRPGLFRWQLAHLLSDGSRESRASEESFLLSGCVMLSIRSTHISMTLPSSWSIWAQQGRDKTSVLLSFGVCLWQQQLNTVILRLYNCWGYYVLLISHKVESKLQCYFV